FERHFVRRIVPRAQPAGIEHERLEREFAGPDFDAAFLVDECFVSGTRYSGQRPVALFAGEITRVTAALGAARHRREKTVRGARVLERLNADLAERGVAAGRQKPPYAHVASIDLRHVHVADAAVAAGEAAHFLPRRA